MIGSVLHDVRGRRSARVARWCLAVFVWPVQAAAQPPEAARAWQVPWAVIDAVGYAGAGFGLGLAGTLAKSTDGLGTELAIIGASTVVAGGLGAVLGRRVVARKADGRPVPRGLRTAVLAGAVLAGGTLGALAAVPLINGEGTGTPLGADDATVAITTGSGAALGVLFAVWQRRSLTAASRLSVTPFYAGHGISGIRVGMTF